MKNGAKNKLGRLGFSALMKKMMKMKKPERGQEQCILTLTTDTQEGPILTWRGLHRKPPRCDLGRLTKENQG